jgi:diaminopimelate decarboxylase
MQPKPSPERDSPTTASLRREAKSTIAARDDVRSSDRVRARFRSFPLFLFSFDAMLALPAVPGAAPAGPSTEESVREILPPMEGRTPWWCLNGLDVADAGLTLGGQPVAAAAARHGTPLYLYDPQAVRRQAAALKAALSATGLEWRIRYAMKANRFGPILDAIRAEGDVGIDACSPRELELARAHAFATRDISVTASMLAERDLDAFVAAGVHVNLDSLSVLRRYARRVPRGTRCGLRIDPDVQIGYGDDARVAYGRSKFGLLPASVADAAALARQLGLVIDTLHVHCGWGLQAGALPAVRRVFAGLAELAGRLPSVETINVGGGLGARRRADDEPLPLAGWAEAIRETLGPLRRRVACEPGTLLVDWAGVLLVQVNTVEEKNGTTWLGVDAGHNVNVYAAHYGLPIGIVHVARPAARPECTYSVAGNINESNDVFARGIALPRVAEGDLLAFLPAGAYGSSMASDHCLRGFAKEVVLEAPLTETGENPAARRAPDRRM